MIIIKRSFNPGSTCSVSHQAAPYSSSSALGHTTVLHCTPCISIFRTLVAKKDHPTSGGLDRGVPCTFEYSREQIAYLHCLHIT